MFDHMGKLRLLMACCFLQFCCTPALFLHFCLVVLLFLLSLLIQGVAADAAAAIACILGLRCLVIAPIISAPAAAAAAAAAAAEACC